MLKNRTVALCSVFSAYVLAYRLTQKSEYFAVRGRWRFETARDWCGACMMSFKCDVCSLDLGFAEPNTAQHMTSSIASAGSLRIMRREHHRIMPCTDSSHCSCPRHWSGPSGCPPDSCTNTRRGVPAVPNIRTDAGHRRLGYSAVGC